MSNTQQSTRNSQQATNNQQTNKPPGEQPAASQQLSIRKGTWALIRYRPVFFWLSVTAAVYAFGMRAVPGWLQKSFFDRLTGEAGVGLNLSTILALIVAVELSRMIVDTGGSVTAAKVRLAGQTLLRKNVVQNILRKPGAQPLPIAIGDAIDRLDNDLADFGDFPTWIPELVGHAAFTLFALVVMVRIDGVVTAVAILPLIGVFFLNRFAWERFLRYHKQSRDSDSAVTGFLGELFGAIQAMKVADAEAATMHYFHILNERRRKLNVRQGIFYAMFQSVSDHMGDVAVAVMVLLAGARMAGGSFTVGDFALFSSYLFFVARFPATIGSYLSEIAQQRVVLDRTQAMHPDAPPESLVMHGPIYENSHRRGAEDAEILKMEIVKKTAVHHLSTVEIRGLMYRHPQTNNTQSSSLSPQSSSTGIFDINLTLPRGSFTVITGRIGSGKTTLLRVLLGLLPAESGEIRWNGEPVTDPAAFFVPPRSAYTPQVPHLFSESLRDNILLGLPEDGVDLMGAVETAVLTPDIAQLENGLDTIVGPRGVRLSGGQVQRAATARMLVRDAGLLVFDDLSSALDVETEALLWERLLAGGQGSKGVEGEIPPHPPAPYFLGRFASAGGAAAGGPDCGDGERPYPCPGHVGGTAGNLGGDAAAVAGGDGVVGSYEMSGERPFWEGNGRVPFKLVSPRGKKFLSYYKPYRKLFVADMICAFVVSATTLLIPLCANYVTKNVLAGRSAETLNQVYGMGSVMLLLIVIHTVSNMFVSYQGHMMGALMERDMRRELFDHYQKLSFGFYDEQKVGQLMTRITNDSFDLAELFHHGPEDIVISLLNCAGAFVILISINANLALIIFLFLPIMAIYAFHFNKKMKVALRRSRDRIGDINARVEDTLSGIRVVKSFTNEGIEAKKFAYENDRFLDSRRDSYRGETYFYEGLIALTQLMTVAVIVFGGISIVRATLDLPELIAFLLCVGILIEPIRRYGNFTRLYQEGIAGFERFMEVLEIEPDIQDAANAVELNPAQGNIEFRDVSFRYKNGRGHVFKNLSLDIKAGEFVALVGTSGIGKTTLCSLIPRFYEISGGEILLDGTNIKEIRLDSLRKNVGVVQQDVYLFAGTVAENIGYGKVDASRAEIVAAAKKANAHAFIMALPDGYDTDIGQRGVKLSGGQKQRLSIARVFLKDPPVIIFDEATSALDNESEQAVRDSLEKLADTRTMIVIAHRLSTVRNAQRIVVLTEKGIEEQGTHEELIALDGTYANLYNMQLSM